MPSWQSYLVHPFLRFFIKRKLVHVQSAAEARGMLTYSLPPLPGAGIQEERLGGVPGEWVHAQNSAEGHLLYLHGGGYFSCSPLTHRAVTSAFALRGFSVFAPDYRLAPEHPFPAAVEDALAVYRALLARIPAAKLVIAGDSAGGGLALSLMFKARAEGLPLPAGLVLFSPWTDLACTGASLHANADRDSMLYAPRLTEAAAAYLAGADPRDPLASPLYGDLTGLPPMLIQASEMEILFDDATRLAARAREAGVEVSMTVWDNLPHVWQISQAILPEARAALDEAANFAVAALADPLASKAMPA